MCIRSWGRLDKKLWNGPQLFDKRFQTNFCTVVAQLAVAVEGDENAIVVATSYPLANYFGTPFFGVGEVHTSSVKIFYKRLLLLANFIYNLELFITTKK